MIILATSIGTFLIGWYSNTIYTNISKYLSNKKLTKSINDRFKNIFNIIKSGQCKFKSRVNQTVYISINIKEHGDVDLVYFLDKKDIAIFKENKCIYTSYLVDKKIIDDTITIIRTKFHNEINDVVEVLGIVVSKMEFDKMFGKGIKIGNQDKSDIEKIIEKNNSKLCLDDILDKIGINGYESLTIVEKEFLKKHK